MGINIAIDGPAGSGKSTAGKILAKKLNLTYFDTGLMYRAFTYHCFLNQINFKNKAEIINCLNTFNFDIRNKNEIYLNDIKITKKITSIEVIENINYITSVFEVREKLVELQKSFIKPGNFVIIGRDIGTVVCPQAEFKFFITASVEKRAKRRHKQTSKITLEETKELIIARDKNDESRSTGPLKKADDAFEIDNSNLTLEQTVGAMLKIMENKNG